MTLIELCVVLAVVAILVASTAVLYTGMVRKARMTQARTGLKLIQKTEAIYFTEWEVYTDDLRGTEFDPDRYDNYSFTVGLDNDERGYTAHAHGLGPMEGDLWRIRPEGEPVHDPAAGRRFE